MSRCRIVGADLGRPGRSKLRPYAIGFETAPNPSV